MHIIVQKFGGTSVATPESRDKVIEKIQWSKRNGKSPVVVVSAIGRKGSPYATDTLIDFVNKTSGDMSDHSYDLLVSCGEIISAVTLVTLLNNTGLKAKAFTGGQAGIITNHAHRDAELITTDVNGLKEALEKDIIPVVAGFQGITTSGEFTTLGRGGSDTTASILGMALKAEQIEIFTDVDGIMTADPRVCDIAKIIPEISYEEVFQMADSGAKVIHPKAVEYAKRANIPLIIRNTFSSEKGTYVLNGSNKSPDEVSNKIITSVAHRSGRVQFIINENILVQENILSKMADKDISIDLINIFPSYIVFTINSDNRQKLQDILTKDSYNYTVVDNCAKITVIGEGMTGVPGVMSRIIKALTYSNVDVLQTADSLTTISCLINESMVSKAITVLHEEFNL